MARQPDRGWARGNDKKFIHSRIVVPSGNAACISRLSRGYVKQNVKPVNVTSTDVKRESVTGRIANTGSLNEGYVRPNVNPPVLNASRTNVKTLLVGDGYVKQDLPANVTHSKENNTSAGIRLQDCAGGTVVASDGRAVANYNPDKNRVRSAPDVSDPTAKVISPARSSVDITKAYGRQKQAAKVISATELDSKGSNQNSSECDLIPLFDINHMVVEDKFANSILHVHRLLHNEQIEGANSETYNAWRRQSDFDFGFVPLSDQMVSNVSTINHVEDKSPLQIHDLVRATNKPNFMQARIPVQSQLNVRAWKKYLANYWDRQLIELIEFGFPLDFNRSSPLIHEQGNHKSAVEFPADIEAYIEEEKEYGALLGPFDNHPIPSGHCSPFMTRAKPNSDRRRIIIDLSWPIGASVNAGIDKTSYLGGVFSLTFPTVDDITSQLKRLGRGALLYKIDISRAFRHVKVDPGDYDLLGLDWQGTYVDTCMPFGTRHGSQIFQRLSDAVRYIMRQKGYTMIDYIDDYVGMGVPSVAWSSYDALTHLMRELGLTISTKKLVPPATQVTCLGVLIDTVRGTIAIPPEKLADITQAVHQWLSKDVASKRQLQSILGLLLYVHKCVKPARVFLNRMLELLRFAQDRQKILLTPEFKRDLRWFAKFLPTYNGVSLYDHRKVDTTLELDACLTGFGGCCGNLVYHLPIQRGFMNWTIVHLEMVNILIAVRLFKHQWASHKVLIRCDNQAVVSVLRSGKTRDPYLAACARNIWYASTTYDIDLQYAHIRGTDNKIADVLSRWQGSPQEVQWLHSHVMNPIWLHVSYDLLELDPDL